MIVGDLYVECITIIPYETNPELIINAYGMLAFAVAPQRMQLVARGDLQIREADRNIDHLQFSPSNFAQIWRRVF